MEERTIRCMLRKAYSGCLWRQAEGRAERVGGAGSVGKLQAAEGAVSRDGGRERQALPSNLKVQTAWAETEGGGGRCGGTTERAQPREAPVLGQKPKPED